uniref:Uncharacterized protein n=1 Tax=Noccaea caerulescens TaxID=107243 RepID=A0A1J3IFZ3_NOCCA
MSEIFIHSGQLSGLDLCSCYLLLSLLNLAGFLVLLAKEDKYLHGFSLIPLSLFIVVEDTVTLFLVLYAVR